MTLERYSCLSEKQLQDPNNKSKLKIFVIYIIILWVCAVSFALAKTLSIEQVYHAEADHYACGSTFNDRHEQIYTILKWIIAFVFPYSVIIVFSCMLLKFLAEWSDKANALHAKLTINCNTTPNEKETLAVPNKSSIYIETESERRDSEFKTGCCFFFSKNSQSDQENKNNTTSNNSYKNSSSQLITKCLRTSSAPSTYLNRVARIKQRSTRFVLAVVFSFLCTWSPLWIYQIIIIFTEFQSIFLMIMHNLTLVITYMEGVLDPLFYLLLTENFREFISKRNFSFYKKSFK